MEIIDDYSIITIPNYSFISPLPIHFLIMYHNVSKLEGQCQCLLLLGASQGVSGCWTHKASYKNTPRWPHGVALFFHGFFPMRLEHLLFFLERTMAWNRYSSFHKRVMFQRFVGASLNLISEYRQIFKHIYRPWGSMGEYLQDPAWKCI